MTLILTCLTGTHVFMVSDRRLTALDGPMAGAVLDDERNKATLYEGNLVFGYTGLADLPGARTDVWLAHTLCNAPEKALPRLLRHLAAEATKVFASPAIPRQHRRHAFLAVGWTVPPGRTELFPTVVRIDNALDDIGGFLPEARDHFRGSIRVYGDFKRDFLLESVGAHVNPGQRHAILRFVSRAVRKNAGPRAILRSLIISVRWMARYQPTVGRSIMAICVPKAAVEMSARSSDVLVLAGSPAVNRATYLYVNEKGDQTSYFGPNLVGGGWAVSNPTIQVLR